MEEDREVTKHGGSRTTSMPKKKMDEKGKNIVLLAPMLITQVVKWKQVTLVTVLAAVLMSLLQYWGLLLLFLVSLPLGGWAAHKIIGANKLWQSDNILNIWHSLAALVSHGDAPQGDSSTTSRKHSITVHSELKEFVQNVMRDFILTWYGQLSEDEQFTSELFNHLEDLAVSLTKRLSRSSQYDMAEHVLRQFHNHYHTYNLARARLGLSTAPVKQTRQPKISEKDFAEEYFRFSSEHIAARDSTFELQYLQSVVKALTKVILPKMMFDCTVGRRLLQEIITYKVIYVVINLLTEEDFLYRAIVKILSEGPNPKEADYIDYIDSVESSPPLFRSDRSGSMTYSEKAKDRRGDGDVHSEGASSTGFVNDNGCDKPAGKDKGDNVPRNASVMSAGSTGNVRDARQSDGSRRTESAQKPGVQPLDRERGDKANYPSRDDVPRRVPVTLDGLQSNTQVPPGLVRTDSKNKSPTTPFEDIVVTDAMAKEVPSVVIRSVSADNSPARQMPSLLSSVLGRKKIPNPETLQDRIYHELHIPETTVATEYRSTKEYTLYVIQYSTVDPENPTELEMHEVKRRYREFLNLHSRLEDHTQLKKNMKDLKEPNRLFTLPVGNMNKDYVEHRRHFLEAYLQGLLSKKDIHNSSELKEFLAYGTDPHIAYVKKAPNMVPRFDKMFVRSMSGFIDTLKTAFPNVSVGEGPEPSKAEEDLSMSDAAEAEQEATNRRMFAFPELYRSPVEGMMEMYQCEIDYTSNGWQPWQLSRDQVDSAPKVLGPRPQGDGCDMTDATKEKGLSTDEIALATLTLHILCETFQHCENEWLVSDQVQQILTVVTGKLFNSWLMLEIGDLTTPDKWAYYLFKLREAVWDKKVYGPRTDKEKQQTKRHAHQCLVDFFPTLLKTAVGEEDYRGALWDAMESLQYPRLNRHFIYTMLDIALEMVVPEIKTVQLQEALLKKAKGTR